MSETAKLVCDCVKDKGTASFKSICDYYAEKKCSGAELTKLQKANVKRAVLRLKLNGTLKQKTGTGCNGSFKPGAAPKKVAAKKPAAKKPAAKKPAAKKPAAKKTAVKKAAPKKATTPKKKKATTPKKKPAVKKATPKKAVKKSTPKKKAAPKKK